MEFRSRSERYSALRRNGRFAWHCNADTADLDDGFVNVRREYRQRRTPLLRGNVRYSRVRLGLLRGLVPLLRGAGVRSRARVHFHSADRYVHYAFVRPQKRLFAAFGDRIRRRTPRLHYLRHNFDRRLKLLQAAFSPPRYSDKRANSRGFTEKYPEINPKRIFSPKTLA